MTPKFRVWDKDRSKWLDKDYVLAQDGRIGYYVANTDGYGNEAACWVEFEEEQGVEAVFCTGHRSIGNQAVYDGDYLRFPGQQEVYEVKWDQPEGTWTIAYKGMTAFKIGMTWFMELAGNRFEGVKERKEEG